MICKSSKKRRFHLISYQHSRQVISFFALKFSEIQAATQGLLTKIDFLIVLYSDIGKKLFLWLQKRLSEFLSTTWTWFGENVVQPIKSQIQIEFENLKDYTKEKAEQAVKRLKGFVEAQWQKFLDYLNKQYAILKHDVEEKINEAFLYVKEKSEDAYQRIVAQVNEYMDQMLDKIKETATNTRTYIESLVNNYLAPLVGQISESFTQIYSSIDNNVSRALTSLQSFYNSIYNSLSNIQAKASELFAVAKEKYKSWSEWVYRFI